MSTQRSPIMGGQRPSACGSESSHGVSWAFWRLLPTTATLWPRSGPQAGAGPCALHAGHPCSPRDVDSAGRLSRDITDTLGTTQSPCSKLKTKILKSFPGSCLHRMCLLISFSEEMSTTWILMAAQQKEMQFSEAPTTWIEKRIHE